jgi:hypothetical protein
MADDSAPPSSRRAPSDFDGLQEVGANLVESSYHDDLEDPSFDMKASDENVYDYLMFISPTESATSHGKLTVDTSMGYLLVLLTLFIQGLLLYAVYDRVVVNAIQWQAGIVKTDGDNSWNFVGGTTAEGQCNDGQSLCTMANNTFECAPPSVRLAGKWEELDTNGDGVWTREEVKAAKKDLKCKYVANPVEVFDVFIKFVKAREKIIWIHPDVREGRALPKPYFDYAMGDIIMCGYRNEAMCRNVLQRGFFDAALIHNTVPRVGNTLDSALDYCTELLRPGGTCERTLPSTYGVWKIESDEECKEKKYSKFVYEHPVTGVKKSFLAVDYKARTDYEKTQTAKFKVFKTLIVMIWIMSMVSELKRLIEIVTWACRFEGEESCRENNVPMCQMQKKLPGKGAQEEQAEQAADGPDSGRSESKASEKTEETEIDPDMKTFKINGIRIAHRILTLVITALRFAMLWVLTIVGNSLLLQSADYMSLLFDAISLVFVIDLANMIACFVLRQSIREQATDVENIEVQMFGPLWLTRRQSLIDMGWFAFVVVAATCLMVNHYLSSVVPVDEALQCTCLGVGETCVEAQKFTYDFWWNYWKEVTPQVFKDVRVMRERVESLLEQPAVASAVQRGIGVLHSH